MRNYQKIEKIAYSSNELKSVFNNNSKSILFNAEITFYSNYFSGLMVFKQMEDSSSRVVFTTQFGLKIFDFEFKGNDFTVKYCVEQLNKKSITNTLKRDIQLLLMNDIKAHTLIRYKNIENSHLMVLKAKATTGCNYYFSDMNTSINQIIKAGILRKKVNISFFGLPNEFPDSIKIEHYNIKLNIDMKHIKRE